MKKIYSSKWKIALFMAPALILFVGILVAPIFMSAYYSFFNFKGFGAKTFVGLDNYKELFTSERLRFWKALGNCCLLAVLSVFIQLPISLFFALVLGKGRKGERGFLSIFFMPVLISTIVIGQLWLKIYNPEYGILNTALRALGLESWTRIWLGDPKTALIAAFIPTVWQFVGYHMLLLYAGVKSVPTEYREAAMIDGASEAKVNRYIVLPYIKPILRISTIFAVTGSFKSFDLIYVLMGGEPGNNPAVVPTILLINQGFDGGRYGMGSAIALLLIVLCFAAAILINVIFRDRETVSKKERKRG